MTMIEETCLEQSRRNCCWRTVCRSALVVSLWLWLNCPRLAQALELELSAAPPALAGTPVTVLANVTEPDGEVLYRWQFGEDDVADDAAEFVSDLAEVSHTYAEPGHYNIRLVARDASSTKSVNVVQTVHAPLPERPPNSANSLIYDPSRQLIYNVNQDNDSLTVTDARTIAKLCELPVFKKPKSLALSPTGKIWVLHQDDYAIAIIDPSSWETEKVVRLPYGSQPISLVFSPVGDVAYATLRATGQIAKFDADTGDIVEIRAALPWAQGLSVSSDGRRVLVTRFISSGDHGEVLELEGGSLNAVRSFKLALDPGHLQPDGSFADTDQGARGLPNYLFNVAINPDERYAWVPAKKDNIEKGLVRDGQVPTPETSTRHIVARINLMTNTESPADREDIDDRNLATNVVFSPLGDYAFVTVQGNGLVAVYDAYTAEYKAELEEAGFGPKGLALTDDGKLFVHAFLSRQLSAYDVSEMLNSKDFTPRKLGEVSLVSIEKLEPTVLKGKQVFYHSEDPRMSQEHYISCATCHIEGFEDGQVWDFTDRGEGLRNTTSLLGKRGTGHGPLHWSANFDEIQDFEHDIRGPFGGTGFLTDEQFAEGTTNQTLGDSKAGKSPELDALSDFVTSLDTVNRSPYRNQDGTMTANAQAGELIFDRLMCSSCHAGEDMTDSAQGKLHDVGTLTERSGKRLGMVLPGIDTPTLLGVWETAPYLHDGSAPTLKEVFTLRNSDGLHGATSALLDTELDQLVDYLRQLDNAPVPTELVAPAKAHCDLPSPTIEGASGSGGTSPQEGAGQSGANEGASGGDSSLGNERPEKSSPLGRGRGSTGSCTVLPTSSPSAITLLVSLLGLGLMLLRRGSGAAAPQSGR